MGFIYIWYDTVKKRFYLGSHYGTPDDGYVGSGTYFKRAFNKRPHTFKRRILQHIVGSKADVLGAEQSWLNLIEDDELGKKYYNLKKSAKGGSVKGRPFKPISEEQRQKLRKPKSSTVNYHKPKSSSHKENISIALKTSSLVNNSGINNPKHSGITNDEFREHYIQCCISLGYQPGLKRFSKWFNAATGKVFPSSLSAHRFNFGKDLFAEVERSYGLFHRRSQSD